LRWNDEQNDDHHHAPRRLLPDRQAALSRAAAVAGLRAGEESLRDACPDAIGERVLEVVAAEPSAREGSRIRWREYLRRGFQVNKFDM
jgi:DNA polymerase-3 subunit chi